MVRAFISLYWYGEHGGIGTTIFVTDITSPFMCYRTQWTGTYSNSNTEMLKRGLVHLTQESAIEHSKALILLSGGKV